MCVLFLKMSFISLDRRDLEEFAKNIFGEELGLESMKDLFLGVSEESKYNIDFLVFDL